MAEREHGRDEAAQTERAVAAERERMETDAARALTEERARAGDEARRRLSESLNQSLRRIRQTSAEHELLQLLLEDSTACAARAVVLLIENNQARVAAWRGAALREEDEANPLDLGEAAAIASCVESHDPVVALGAPGRGFAVTCIRTERGGHRYQPRQNLPFPRDRASKHSSGTDGSGRSDSRAHRVAV